MPDQHQPPEDEEIRSITADEDDAFDEAEDLDAEDEDQDNDDDEEGTF